MSIVRIPPRLEKGEGGVNIYYLPRRGGESEKLKKEVEVGGGGTLPFAKLCYTFEERFFFSATIILWKNVILSCLKINMKIFHELR